MSDLPVEDAPDVAESAHKAEHGRVVYITEKGKVIAGIVGADVAAAADDEAARVVGGAVVPGIVTAASGAARASSSCASC